MARSDGIRETFKSGFKPINAAFLESKRSLCTFLIFIFSRLYIRIDNDNIEIRKYFKVRKYSLNKCDIIVKEINETVNGDLIYELTIKYENNKVLKVNSNSLDSEYRTKKYVSLLKTYKK
mgnify:CR=1 FL=1